MNDISIEPKPTSKKRTAIGSREIRRARARRIAQALGLFAGVPTLLAVIYYGFIAASHYESVAVITVESGPPGEGEANQKATALEHEVEVVAEHVKSRAMLESLDKGVHIADHYRSGGDWWSRLGKGAGSEATHDYYLNHVTVQRDSRTTLTIRVLAFSPEAAESFASAIVERADGLLKKRSERVAKELTEPAERELQDARAALSAARAAQPHDDLEVDVARDRVVSALRGLETARAEAARRKRGLVVISEPSLATEPSGPRRMWSISSVFVTALVLGGVFLLLGDVVREHAKF